jgi:hypothetical protein
MTIHSKLTPAGRFFAAAVVIILAFACTADAIQTTTTANAAFVPYSLAAGAVSSNLTPPTSVPVLLMGNCTTIGFRGAGFVSLLRIPGSFVEWSGLNSASTNAADNGTVTHGFNSAAGTQIVLIDYNSQVKIEVGSTGDTVRIHNTAGAARAGSTTWIW